MPVKRKRPITEDESSKQRKTAELHSAAAASITAGTTGSDAGPTDLASASTSTTENAPDQKSQSPEATAPSSSAAAAGAISTAVDDAKPDLDSLHIILKKILRQRVNSAKIPNVTNYIAMHDWLDATHPVRLREDPSDPNVPRTGQLAFEAIKKIPFKQAAQQLGRYFLQKGIDGKSCDLFVDNRDKAFYWTLAAAAEGCPKAVNTLAVFCFGQYNRNNQKYTDYQMGIELLHWAAGNSHPGACHNLGAKYEVGVRDDNQREILKPNLNKALDFYQKAKTLNYPHSAELHSKIARIYLVMANHCLYGKEGTAQDKTRALQYVKNADTELAAITKNLETKDSSALKIDLYLTQAHYHFNEIWADNSPHSTSYNAQSRAIDILLSISETSSPKDQLIFFERYLSDSTIPQNVKLAEWWLSKAAEKNEPSAKAYFTFYTKQKPGTPEQTLKSWQVFKDRFNAPTATAASSSSSSAAAIATGAAAPGGSPVFSGAARPAAANQTQQSTNAAGASTYHQPPSP